MTADRTDRPGLAPPDPPPLLPRLRRRPRLDGAGLAARRDGAPGRRRPARRTRWPPRPGHFPGAGEERHLPVHGRRPQPARAVRLQARSCSSITASRSPTRSSRGERFAFMDTFTKERPKLLGTTRKFARHGSSGGLGLGVPAAPRRGRRRRWRSIRSVATDVFNHAPAKLFVNTGSTQFGRPSMGAWVTYGIGSESQNLPGFVVLQSGPRGPARRRRELGQRLPADAPTRASRSAPAASRSSNLASPDGVTADRQRRTVDAIRDLNRGAAATRPATPRSPRGSPPTRWPTGCRSSAPELIDLAGETPATLDAVRRRAGQAVVRQQLPARPPAGRARASASCSSTTPTGTTTAARPDLDKDLDTVCREIDQPCAALVRDLKQRGLLDDTLVVWGGEFGRTPMGEVREYDRPQPPHRRAHHVDGRRRRQARPHPGRDRRVRLRPRRGPRPRPRPPGHHPAPARPRPHQAHLPLPGPRLPPDRRRRTAWSRSCSRESTSTPGVSKSAGPVTPRPTAPDDQVIPDRSPGRRRPCARTARRGRARGRRRGRSGLRWRCPSRPGGRRGRTARNRGRPPISTRNREIE